MSNKWPVAVGTNIIINKIDKYTDVPAKVIKVIDNIAIVKLHDAFESYRDYRLVAEPMYKSGHYMLNKSDNWSFNQDGVIAALVESTKLYDFPLLYKTIIATKKFIIKNDLFKPMYVELLQKNINRYKIPIDNNQTIMRNHYIDLLFDPIKDERIVILNSKTSINEIPILFTAIQSDYVVDKDNVQKKITMKYLTPIHSQLIKKKIEKKLNPSNKLPVILTNAKHEIVVNNLHLVSDDLIVYPEHEIAEGAKLLKWIEENLIYHRSNKNSALEIFMFADLITLQADGCIYIKRAGLSDIPVISENMIKLELEKNLLNKQLDALAITSKIIHTNDENVKNELIKILSLEYYIAIQPEPRYLLFVLKRLIYAWYGDVDLSAAINKISFTINNYRCRRDKSENIKLGVVPFILIYLNHGAVNFNRALSKINYYFTNYIHTGWSNNSPDYFTKYNDLIYYSNGSPHIKIFFDTDPRFNNTPIYKTDAINPRAFMKDGIDIVAPYPQSYHKGAEILKFKSELREGLYK